MRYNIDKATVSDIKKQKAAILQHAAKLDSQDGSKRRKTMKVPSNIALEDALFTWFMQKRSLGQPISGPLLCEKALLFNQELSGNSDFKASTGWLRAFKSRHGIRELQIEIETLSGDSNAANIFIKTFFNLMQKEGYTTDDVYNADKTGINWRALPNKSLAARQETRAPGFKTSKERITAMVCANAGGKHILPLLVIDKAKKPCCFKNVVCFFTSYKSQKSA